MLQIALISRQTCPWRPCCVCLCSGKGPLQVHGLCVGQQQLRTSSSMGAVCSAGPRNHRPCRRWAKHTAQALQRSPLFKNSKQYVNTSLPGVLVAALPSIVSTRLGLWASLAALNVVTPGVHLHNMYLQHLLMSLAQQQAGSNATAGQSE